MDLRSQLQAFFDLIADEAERNPDFARSLSQVLGSGFEESALAPHQKPSVRGQGEGRGGRRAQAVIDPVAVYREGEDVLHQRLVALDLEQLRDVVAEYGMDPRKLVMKWKTKERIIDHIIEMAMNRAKKGDAFRQEN